MSTPDPDLEALSGIARRHGFSLDAAHTVLDALVRGHGRQAQFTHPELGGMGQWSAGGMLMIGTLFDDGLKARVGALIHDLADLAQAVAQRPSASVSAWPAHLGRPSASGAQNGVEYAIFPQARRLAIRHGGRIVLYDTGDHRLGGVSQQQGGDGGGLLMFDSQHGPVSPDRLSPVTPDAEPAPDPQPPAPPEGSSIPATIAQLHDLMSQGILTRDEFDAKKADLLRRLKAVRPSRNSHEKDLS